LFAPPKREVTGLAYGIRIGSFSTFRGLGPGDSVRHFRPFGGTKHLQTLALGWISDSKFSHAAFDSVIGVLPAMGRISLISSAFNGLSIQEGL
jgi:hypothetical protein